MSINIIRLKRIYTPKTVIGEIWHNGTLLAYSIELPWRNNERRRSCIPEGVYPLATRNSAHFGVCPIVLGVPSRSGILIHAANDADDTDGSAELQGCIAPVTWVRIGNGTVKGMESKHATKVVNDRIFMLLKTGGCTLEITEL